MGIQEGVRALAAAWRKAANDQRGAIAPIAAVVLGTLVVTAGVGMDISRVAGARSELQDATDIKQVEAVNGRLAIESNAIQGQQAQAANLQALAAAQAQSDQQAAMESIRQGHEAAAAQFTGTLN